MASKTIRQPPWASSKRKLQFVFSSIKVTEASNSASHMVKEYKRLDITEAFINWRGVMTSALSLFQPAFRSSCINTLAIEVALMSTLVQTSGVPSTMIGTHLWRSARALALELTSGNYYNPELTLRNLKSWIKYYNSMIKFDEIKIF